MDERGLDQLQPAVELISGLTDENGVSFKISSAFNFNNSSSYDFTDQIDDISIKSVKKVVQISCQSAFPGP